MGMADLNDWIDAFGKPGAVWFVKRLSANDTQLTGGHQAGPYLPKDVAFALFPGLKRPGEHNPRVPFMLYSDSQIANPQQANAIWYNNRLKGGTRNEVRITNLGGRTSPLLDPENTGALAVMAFVPQAEGEAPDCHVWICGGNGTEADLVEERLGPILPGEPVIWRPGADVPRLVRERLSQLRDDCFLKPHEIPPEWLRKFPSGEEIIARTLALRSPTGKTPDMRLLKRRDCEFEMFRSIEEAFYLPRVTQGFSSLDDFLRLPQTVLQSRKSRSGHSLELQARAIFEEEGLRPGADFAHGPVIEGGKRPDFLFPSLASYNDAAFPPERLRMLAAKTTCKDRWRQILKEADRIPSKHLLTLQEGVSENQFREMREAGVIPMVPQGLHKAYPEAIRPHLVTLEGFLAELRLAVGGAACRTRSFIATAFGLITLWISQSFTTGGSTIPRLLRRKKIISMA